MRMEFIERRGNGAFKNYEYLKSSGRGMKKRAVTECCGMF